ncbi:MAG: PLP-dependent aminotransferase family protein [Stappiaceae bacterium]
MGSVEIREKPHRYEEIAYFIDGLLESGLLRPGMRAPSLRSIARQNRASLSTVIQAYRLLEDRGILEARPKSGFYVTAHSKISLETPAPTAPSGKANPVAQGSSILRVIEEAINPSLLPLGCAIPDASLLAAGRLDRLLARTARVKGNKYNNYTSPCGDEDLRSEICRRAMRWGQVLSPEMVAITCGCTEAISLALKATTRPGDTVVIESPTYFGLLSILQAHGLHALELPTDANDGIDVQSLDKALKTEAVGACLFSSSFNNPLGSKMPNEKKKEIIALLTRHNVPLIEDDIYGDIYFGKERPLPFIALAPDADILYCSSFSKTLAPGYRVGWLVTKQRMQDVLEAKLAQTLCGPPLLQKALADFLSSGGYDKHLRRMRRIFSENIDRMTRAIDQHFPQDTRITRPTGGFVLWLELPSGFDGHRMFDLAVQNGIGIVPGEAFTAGEQYRNCIRLSCGSLWDDRIEKGVQTLGRLASELLSECRDVTNTQ